MTNVYIMSLPRSGSTYLYKMIAQSPDMLHLHYEPFNYTDQLQNSSSTDIYNQCVLAMNNIKSQSSGVLIKDTLTYVREIQTDQTYQQLFLNFQNYINDNFYRIKLYRRNAFEQAVSNCIATLTDKWSRKVYDVNFNVVTIDLAHLKSVLDINKQMSQFLVNCPHYDKIIYYEDIAGNTKLDTEWIFDFLTPPNIIQPASTLKNPPKHKVVYNYNELLSWYELHKHEYEIDYDN